MAFYSGVITKTATVEYSVTLIVEPGPPEIITSLPQWENSVAYPTGKKLILNSHIIIGSRAGAGSILIRTRQPHLQRTVGGAFLDGLYSLDTLPQGLKITSIFQGAVVEGAFPNIGAPGKDFQTPYGLAENVGTYNPGWTNWTTNLGLIPLIGSGGIGTSFITKANPITFDPVGMSIMFVQKWEFFAEGNIYKDAITVDNGTLYVGSEAPDDNPLGAEVYNFKGVWEADSDLCPLLTPVENVEVINSQTGAMSWTLPINAVGTIIAMQNNSGIIPPETFYTPELSYTPPSIGISTVRLYACTTYPICRSEPETVIIEPTPEPSIIMRMAGGISLGGVMDVQLKGDPSGIYVVPAPSAGINNPQRLTHDILYERLPGITSQNVKIPKPFAKTAFHGK